MTPTYGDARRHGSEHYTIRSPGLALGADTFVGESAFIGAGAYLARPLYRSDATDIDAESYTGLVYGGASLPLGIEFDLFAALGHTRYEQRRSVHGERYDTDYSAEHVGAGLSVGRSFALGTKLTARPFASYEFMKLNVDGYDEGDAGLFGLQVGRSRSRLRRLNAGTALSYVLDTLDGGFVEGRVAYVGLYGDRRPEADVAMTRDASGYSLRSRGWAEDEHALGLGIEFGLNISESARLSGGYAFVGGEKTAGHQAEILLSIAF